MSLRKKIILLFMGLAVLPLMVLAAFSYWQARTLVRNLVQEDLQETAEIVGQAMDSTSGAIGEEMASFARGIQAHQVWTDPDGEPGPEIDAGSWLARVEFLEYREPGGRLWTLRGERPETEVRCDPGGGHRLVTFSRKLSVRGLEGTLTAGIWASGLLNFDVVSLHHPVQVFADRGDHFPILAADCSDLYTSLNHRSMAAVGGGQGEEEARGIFGFLRGGTETLSAVAKVPGRDWTVVASSDTGTLFAPVNQMVRIYWIFVLGLAVSTALAFSIMIGRFTKSLGELARAAEEIGLGELDPWLPVQTSGELGQLTLAFSRMLARIRQMMSKVDQSGRLAVVGQLSAYLAHEIRNPLSSIKLNLQRMMRWANNGTIPEVCREPLEISLREVERLSASVTGVLELSRAQDGGKETISLHRIVEEAADLLATRFRRQGVELELDLDAEADRALVRPGQVKSIVLNLMVNALEAQPNGGELEVRSHLSRVPDLQIPVVALHFKDKGGGIPPNIRDRIFEPFFTTKSGGSGIGLAMAAQAARDNGGELYLEPSLMKNSGAEFVLVLPLPSLTSPVAVVTEPGTPDYISQQGRLQGKSVETGERVPGRTGVPAHLMTPEGLEAVLALTLSDSEEVN